MIYTQHYDQYVNDFTVIFLNLSKFLSYLIKPQENNQRLMMMDNVWRVIRLI